MLTELSEEYAASTCIIGSFLMVGCFFGVSENGVMGKTQQLVTYHLGMVKTQLKNMVILGMLHYWVCHIISKELLSTGNMMEYDYHPFLILDHVFWQTQVAIANHWLGI